ncbi:hypothetical protein CPter291_1969 [Collimonas pratensis]|nr:hypothetical protein CPter291_1969 [Collimonas pratensis]
MGGVGARGGRFPVAGRDWDYIKLFIFACCALYASASSNLHVDEAQSQDAFDVSPAARESGRRGG